MPNFFSGEWNLALIPEFDPLPYFKKSFLRLSVWDYELLSTAKITTFLAKSLPKFHEPAPSNTIP